MELRVGGKYKFTKKLGNGAFGDIYSGVNIKTNEEVAIKLVIIKCHIIDEHIPIGTIKIEISLIAVRS